MSKKMNKAYKIIGGAFAIAVLHWIAHWLLPMTGIATNMIAIAVSVIVFVAVLVYGFIK